MDDIHFGNRQTVENPVDIPKAHEPLIISVTPAGEFYGLHKDSPDLRYQNSSLPRGLVFMANYREFDNKQELKTRRGSEKDVENLTLLFNGMGYKIPRQHINMTRSETTAAIKHFKKDPELKNVDSCIVIIMSHGCDEKSFYTKDHETMQIDDIVRKFSNSYCPVLIGKPKIFIFQYCRGKLEDTGVVNHVQSVVNNMPQQNKMQIETDAASADVTGVNRDASYTDMFIIFSTIEGFVSFRHPEHGSWLIESICDIFMKNAFEMNLNDLMMMVSQKVRNKYKENGKMQVCERVMRGFDRHFYFNPRPLRDTFDPSQKFEFAELMQKINELVIMNDTPGRNKDTNEVYQKILSNGPVNVEHVIADRVRYGTIERNGDYIIMKDLDKLNPDGGATVLEYEHVVSLIPRTCVVRFTLTHQGTKLGCIHIRLDGHFYPRRIQHFLQLVIGSSGRGSFKKSRFDAVGHRGRAGEWLCCASYIDDDGKSFTEALYEVENATHGSPWIEGVVYGYDGQEAGFGICIKEDRTDTWLNPVIGHVTLGMNLLKEVIEKYSAKENDGHVDFHDLPIKFSECGVIIGKAE